MTCTDLLHHGGQMVINEEVASSVTAIIG